MYNKRREVLVSMNIWILVSEPWSTFTKQKKSFEFTCPDPDNPTLYGAISWVTYYYLFFWWYTPRLYHILYITVKWERDFLIFSRYRGYSSTLSEAYVYRSKRNSQFWKQNKIKYTCPSPAPKGNCQLWERGYNIRKKTRETFNTKMGSPTSRKGIHM